MSEEICCTWGRLTKKRDVASINHGQQTKLSCGRSPRHVTWGGSTRDVASTRDSKELKQYILGGDQAKEWRGLWVIGGEINLHQQMVLPMLPVQPVQVSIQLPPTLGALWKILQLQPPSQAGVSKDLHQPIIKSACINIFQLL